MKALIVITGRGLGGDSVIAYNIIEGLEAKGVQCEIALDESAPGLLFKKKGRTWHKIKIPQAGGHAATKASSVKAAFKMLTATFKARSLIKKLDVDIVVGVIGGGAIVGSVGAKLAGKPGVSIISTPLDSKICPKLNQCYALPEMKYFLPEHLPKNINHTLYPLSEGVGNGNPDIALEKLKETGAYETYKPDIVLYDVLGDVVCGGFSMPMRKGYADKVFIITSGENMAIHAGANIAMAVQNFRNRGYAALGGIILNRRNVKREEEKVQELAEDFETKVIGKLTHSDLVTDAEEQGKTLMECYAESEMATEYRILAEQILNLCREDGLC